MHVRICSCCIHIVRPLFVSAGPYMEVIVYGCGSGVQQLSGSQMKWYL